MFSRLDFFIWVSLAAAALGFIFLYQARFPYSAENVVIMVNNEEYATIALKNQQEVIVREVEGVNGKTIIEIRDQGVRVTSSACPDKLCVHWGRINKPGEMLVCLPNRVVVTITSEEYQDIDFYTN